jgi:hypothetical protein
MKLTQVADGFVRNNAQARPTGRSFFPACLHTREFRMAFDASERAPIGLTAKLLARIRAASLR